MRSCGFVHSCSPNLLPEDGALLQESSLVRPVCVFAQKCVLNVLSQNSTEVLRKSSFSKLLQCTILTVFFVSI